jgi:PAS domain S-box-containing protein
VGGELACLLPSAHSLPVPETTPSSPGRLTGYVAAVLLVATAVVARLLLDQWLVDRAPFVSVFGVVVFVAWRYGLAAGVFSLGISSATVARFILEPRGSFAIAQPQSRFALGAFVVVSLGAIAFVEYQRRFRRRTAERHQQLEQDVSRHRRAEEALRESEERFRLASIAGRVGVWDWNIVTNAVSWSDSLYEIHGVPRGEFAGTVEAFASLVHPDDRALVNDALQRTLAEDIPYDVEFRSVRPDGRLMWIYTHATVERDQNGRPIRMLGGTLDITRRKEAELALRQSEDQMARDLEDMTRLQTISSELISEDNAETLYEQLVAAAMALMRADGASLQTLSDSPRALHLLASRGLDADATAHWTRITSDPTSRWGVALQQAARVVIPDVRHEPFWSGTTREHFQRCAVAALQTTPLVTRDGRTIGLLSTHWSTPRQPGDRELRLLDVLARQAADILERVRSNQALKEADRRKDEFLATLAHELRNPLAPIAHSLELIKRAHGNAELLERARAMMERQLEHLVRLVDDLLDVSRITRNKLELKTARVELGPLIHNAIEICHLQAEKAGHELSVVLPSEPVWLEADAVRLTQVFGNLLTNACKFTEPHGEIRITAVLHGDVVVVSVKDNGIGIPSHMLAILFDPFTQGGRSLEHAAGGLGIGLSLVKWLVEMHGGRVEALSDGEGRGSEFRVHLPVLATPEITGTSPAFAARPPVVARRFLVVDDNHDSAVSLAMLLTLTGNVAVTAHDGVEALQQVAAFRPEIVLLDLGLPRMTGYDVCRTIRAQPGGGDIVVIALTGWGQDDDRRRTAEAGFDGHLVKPVDESALTQMITSLLASQRPRATQVS